MSAKLTTPMTTAAIANRAFSTVVPPRRKNNIPILIIVVLIVAILAIGIARNAATPPVAETKQVVSAAIDLPPGCRIAFSSLHYIRIPAKYFKEGMFTSYEELVGKTTRTFIPAREPLTRQVISTGELGLASELPAGQRAITLKLSEDGAVDQQIRPGDRVDVLATTTHNNKQYTKTIGESLLVLLSMPKEAALSDAWRNQSDNRVTLAASPADCEVLSQSQESSKIRLILRGRGDFGRAQLSGSDDRDLLPHDALRQEPPHALSIDALPAPPLAPASPDKWIDMSAAAVQPAKWIVQMFAGAKKEIQEIDNNAH